MTRPLLALLPTRPATTGEDYFVAPDKLVAGNPKQTVWLDYQDASGEFCAGLWASEPGEWRIRYTEEEYCRLLEGCSVITDADGHATIVRAGDEFTIPAGFAGTWRVVERTLKRFVIHEPAVLPGA